MGLHSIEQLIREIEARRDAMISAAVWVVIAAAIVAVWALFLGWWK